MTTDERFIDFLREEMRRRDFTSVRQFSAWLGTRLDALQHEAGRIQSTAQPSPDASIARLRALGVDGFWQLSDGEQNAILHGMFGNWRIAVNAREVVGFQRVAP